jgi:ribosomal protein S18 acetylase RimI-like enzyme
VTPLPLPEGFSLRPARDEDAERAAALVNEESVAHLGTPIYSTEQVLRHWSSPVVDRERDVAVVEAPGGEVCGWFSVVCGPPHVEVFALGVVAPAWHGRGLGVAILAECERRAARFLGLAPVGARVVIYAGALADEPAVGALLTGAGYREVRRFQLMRIDFPDVLPAPSVPAGIRLEPVDPERDVAAAFDAHREAFADHWGEIEETLDEFRHWLIDTRRFERELSLLARDGQDVAGYLFAWPEAEEDPSRGYVAALGTRRAHRGRGIAEALLRHVFRTLLDSGKRGCDLHVDSDSLTGATRLYERVGMTAHPRFATWEKELHPAGDHGSSNPNTPSSLRG